MELRERAGEDEKGKRFYFIYSSRLHSAKNEISEIKGIIQKSVSIYSCIIVEKAIRSKSLVSSLGLLL